MHGRDLHQETLGSMRLFPAFPSILRHPQGGLWPAIAGLRAFSGSETQSGIGTQEPQSYPR